MSTDETTDRQERFAVVPVDIATEDLGDDALAARLAADAGKLLQRVREEVGFADPATLRDAGDARAHRLLARALARHRPADAVLSEEGVDDPARLGAERVWIVDPLDGTREFAEPGRSDWAVHVALWQAARQADGETGACRVGDLVAAAVALPALGITLSTAGRLPTLLPAAELPRPLRVIASRSRAPAVVGQVAEALGATVVSLGSAGAKVCAVIRGDAEIYVHAGGQYEWDSAAPVALAQRAGLHTSRLDGSALTYNHADPLLPDLVVCHPSLAEAVLAVTRGA